MPEQETQQVTAQMIKAKLDQAKQAPDSALAKQLRSRLDTGQFDTQLTELGLKRGVNGLQSIEVGETVDVQVEEPKKGLLGRISETGRDIKETFTGAFGKLKEGFGGIKEEIKEGTTIDPETGEFEQGIGSTVLQAAGEGAKGLSGAIGETVIGAGKVLLGQKREEQIAQGFEKGIEKLVQSDAFRIAGKAVKDISEKTGIQEQIDSLSEEQKENFRAVGDLLVLGADIVGGGVATKGGKAVATGAKKAAGEAGELIVDTAATQAAKAQAAKTAISKRVAKQGEALKEIATDVVPQAKNLRDKRVIRALDITQGDLANIEKSTGHEVGVFLAENKLIGNTAKETAELSDAFKKQNMETVREAINNVEAVYNTAEVPGFKNMLEVMAKDVSGTPGLEGQFDEITALIGKKELSLADVQRGKELLDDVESVFKRSGETKAGFKSKGLSKIRKDVKEFIEGEVSKVDPKTDIGKLNRNVSASKQIADAINLRDTRFLTRSALSIGDMATFGAFGGALGAVTGGSTLALGAAALIGKRILESGPVRLRIAKLIDKFDSSRKAKIISEIETGDFSKEAKEIVTQAVRESASQ